MFSFSQSNVFLSLKFVALLFAISATSVHAQTQIKVTTSLGEFVIELFDAQAPVTVQNFLNYVSSGRYANSFVHRVVPGFVIQGGGFIWPEGSSQLLSVATDAPIQNEPGISNLRGTVAMAKLSGDPNSATSQWFVNLADNVGLDSNNGGFTVFGRVIENGMSVVDAIGTLNTFNANLPINNQVVTLSDFPANNLQGTSLLRSNIVFTTLEVVTAPAPPALNRFDDSSNQLILNVDAGSAGIFQISFTIESQDPQVTVKALPTSLIPKTAVEAGFSTFNETTGQLTIPELEVGGQIAYRNLILSLTDAAQLLFTLQSFETP